MYTNVRAYSLTRSGAWRWLAAALAPLGAYATVIDVNSVTRVSDGSGGYTYGTWKPVLAVSSSNTSTSQSGILLDPANDQQTGQADSDFVSSVSGGVANPGFFIQFGTINYGGTNVEHVAFRAIMNEYKTTGNVVNIRFGFDGNLDGKIDLYIGISQQSNQYGMIMNYPNALATATSNTSPSTTDWGTTTYPTTNRTGQPALNGDGNALNLVEGSNFSQIRIDDGVTDNGLNGGANAVPPDNRASTYPGWTTQAEASQTNLDAMVTFAVPLQDINNALTANGAGFSLSSSTYAVWVAVTSTQNQSVNQDAYGYSGLSGTTDDIRFDTIIKPMNGNGDTQPVPEPSAYGMVLGAGLASLVVWRRRGRAV